eukprot:296114-Pelagomonas_calceolata.AAC.2
MAETAEKKLECEKLSNPLHAVTYPAYKAKARSENRDTGTVQRLRRFLITWINPCPATTVAMLQVSPAACASSGHRGAGQADRLHGGRVHAQSPQLTSPRTQQRQAIAPAAFAGRCRVLRLST